MQQMVDFIYQIEKRLESSLYSGASVFRMVIEIMGIFLFFLYIVNWFHSNIDLSFDDVVFLLV
jgi:hypothetical protein